MDLLSNIIGLLCKTIDLLSSNIDSLRNTIDLLSNTSDLLSNTIDLRSKLIISSWTQGLEINVINFGADPIRGGGVLGALGALPLNVGGSLTRLA